MEAPCSETAIVRHSKFHTHTPLGGIDWEAMSAIHLWVMHKSVGNTSIWMSVLSVWQHTIVTTHCCYGTLWVHCRACVHLNRARKLSTNCFPSMSCIVVYYLCVFKQYPFIKKKKKKKKSILIFIVRQKHVFSLSHLHFKIIITLQILLSLTENHLCTWYPYYLQRTGFCDYSSGSVWLILPQWARAHKYFNSVVCLWSKREQD